LDQQAFLTIPIPQAIGRFFRKGKYD
jgi:hypothetical protein